MSSDAVFQLLQHQDIKAKMTSKEDADKPFQDEYNANLMKLKVAVRSGHIKLPTREEMGDMLRERTGRPVIHCSS